MSTKIIQEITRVVGEASVKQQEQLAPYTSVKIGGVAEYYVTVSSLEVLIALQKIGMQNNLPLFVTGSGTSVIFPDEGIKGIVVKNNCRSFHIHNEAKEYSDLLVESGSLTNQVVKYTVDTNIVGIEESYGLPGTIGGAVCMNAMLPASGHHITDALHSATILTKRGEIKEVPSSFFTFGLNKSSLQVSGDILLSVVFRLKKSEDSHSISQRANDALTYRMQTQPKIRPRGYTYRNIPFEYKEAVPFSSGDLRYESSNIRYILNTGESTAADVALLSGKMSDFLTSQNEGEAYTIMITGGSK